ncbi:MAG: efflux RND transporter permease subunit, partial [Acidobacteria bacterium]|nr:efflux RND transporter permease subunit [Acidobacteriota bacterium]
IVVLEAIDRRRRQGLSRAAAARLGAAEVTGAVTASTLTTVSVFFPIVFVQGIAGQLFYDQAVTVCFSLLASLVVALTLIPALTALNIGSALDTASRPEAAGRSPHTLFRWDQPSGDSPRWASATMTLDRFVRTGCGGRGLGRWLLNWLVLAIPRLVAIPVLGLLALSDALFPYLGTIRLGRLTMLPLGNGSHAFSRLLSVGLYPLRLASFIFVLVLGGAWRLLRRIIDIVFWPAGRLLGLLSHAYPAGLKIALRWRWAVVAVAFILFGLAAAELPRLGTNLVPDLSQGQFAFQLHFPEGTPLQATSEAVAGVENALLPEPVFANISSLIGSLPSSASGRRTLGENLAQIDFKLAPTVSAEEEASAVARVRRALALYPQASAELVRPSILTVRPPVAIHVFAEDLSLLDGTAAEVAAALAGVPGITDVTSSAEAGNPEVRVELDRERAGTLGVSPLQVGNTLRRKIRGDKIGEFREGEERLDIRLRASESDRAKATDVAALRISLPDGTAVPISALASVTVGRGPATIQRAGGSRMAEITAKVTSGNLGGTLAQVREAVAGLRLPLGASVEMAGQDEELQVSYNSLRLMLALAIFLVYVVMAAQFESLIHPFVILVSVPLGLVGVVGALWLTSHAISVLVLIGSVMLAGIVVNNAIVLVDAINRRRRDGEDLEAALIGGGGERLRPILMTTTTTVLALLPMALGLGAGDELRAPLAITVIGGLLLATVLTLVVIPCVYRIFAPASPAPVTTGDLVTGTDPLPAGKEA